MNGTLDKNSIFRPWSSGVWVVLAGAACEGSKTQERHHRPKHLELVLVRRAETLLRRNIHSLPCAKFTRLTCKDQCD